MTRYLNALFVIAVAIVALAALPAAAGAGCPGCEEYTLDIPEEQPEAAPAPVPGAAPAPVTPTAPATTTPTETIAPESEVAVAEEEVKPPRPVDPDDDPVPDEAVRPDPLPSAPAVAATQASDLESSSPGGVWPLAIAMVVVAFAGAALALGGRRSARETSDPARSTSGGRA
jgi:hypothetical protein